MKNFTADPHQVITSTSEQKAIGGIESFHLRFRRNSIYVALEEVEDADFFWGRTDVETFDDMWEKDLPIKRIAEEMDRTEIAVFLLAFDRMLKEKIQPRPNWRIW